MYWNNKAPDLNWRQKVRLKRALIIGITGQDGSYMAEMLLKKNYEVHGIIRRASSFNTQRIDHLYQTPQSESKKLTLHYGDLTAGSSLISLIGELQPDEIYNLGAQSHVKVSFETPEYSGDAIGLGSLRVLEAIKLVSPKSKYIHASSSEMYGASPPPQNELTPFRPRSPYATAKLFAHWTTVNYREAYGLFSANAIMFNHESPRRGETFVTRKITRAAARIRAGQQTKLYLGNVNARRDFGYAPEYVEGLWSMMQQPSPDDFVFSTGHSVTIQQFLEYAFEAAGLIWEDHVEFDPRYLRPNEVDDLRGDSSKAKSILGWEAAVSARELAQLMVDADLTRLAHGGHEVIDKPKFRDVF